MRRTFFVTATGTEVGKTYVMASLAAALRARAHRVHVLKPVLSGYEDDNAALSDPGILLNAIGCEAHAASIAQISPWRFRAALSPDMAAMREGRKIPFNELVGFCVDAINGVDGTLLIEGVGGIMVPLDDEHTVVDWVGALNVPAILVAGSYLGTISHTLTARAIAAARGVRVAAIVINESPESPVSLDETAAVIARFCPDDTVFTLKRHGAASELAALLDEG